MIEQIDLEQIPSQTFGVILNDQDCIISLYTRGANIYCDLSINDSPIITGAICLDRQNIIPYEYLGFNGNLMFIDQEGQLDPDYTQFNDRFVLVYSDEF